MRPLLIGLMGLVMTGCVIKDTATEGTREMRGGLKSLVVQSTGDGGAIVSFTFGYLFGIVDAAGIAPIRWTYSLQVPRGAVLAEAEQVMREPQPDKTEILVVGDRQRELEVPTGLRADVTYVLWFHVWYGDEPIGEVLAPVRLVEGEQIEVPYDPEAEI